MDKMDKNLFLVVSSIRNVFLCVNEILATRYEYDPWGCLAGSEAAFVYTFRASVSADRRLPGRMR